MPPGLRRAAKKKEKPTRRGVRGGNGPWRAYMNENLQALADEAGFTREELRTLTRNAFEVSWLTEDRKAAYLDRLAQVQ